MTSLSECPSCKGRSKTDTFIEAAEVMRFTFSKCANCGLVFQAPGDVDRTYAIATANSVPHTLAIDIGGEHGLIYEEAGVEVNTLAQQYVRRIAKYIARHRPADAPEELRILDLGCGTGFMLDALGAIYPSASLVGIDPSEASCLKGREKYRLDLRQGTIQTVPLEQASLDVAIIIGNFQLHANPFDTLKHIYHAMKPNGLLILDTKNVNSTARRLARNIWRLPGCQQASLQRIMRSSYEYMPVAFSKKRLCAAIAEAGFELLDLRTMPPRSLALGLAAQVNLTRLIWSATNWLDGLLDERAWIQVCARKPIAAPLVEGDGQQAQNSHPISGRK